MDNPKLTFTGPQSHVEQLRKLLEKDPIFQPPTPLPWGETAVLPKSPMDRRPAGMEPITYFYVVLGAHFLAHIAAHYSVKGIDALVGHIKTLSKKNNLAIDVTTDPGESSQASKATSPPNASDKADASDTP